MVNNRQSGLTTKYTALYSRLSREDLAIDGDSVSIQHQKTMLEKYAKENGFSNPIHFVDDGFSGGTFDRPEWKKMIAEIESGKISTVITKDMSRVGRDYLQTGFYTEVFFREKNVRFIAIGNNIDSIDKSSSEFAPFLNIMSEWYLRDTSRKIKASHKARGLSGKRLTFAPIYGYKLDPNDKNKWIIDPEAAAVVKRIYNLTIQGIGPYAIARILSEEKVMRPSYYMYSHGIINWKNRDHSIPHTWSGTSILQMLEKPEYKGDTVNFRYDKESYKDKLSKKNDKEDWVIFEGTHPAIIDPETWETAQRCRTVRRVSSTGEPNPLTGLIFCADCGQKLYNRRDVGGKAKDKFGKEYNKGLQDFYHCSTHNLAYKKHIYKCSAHRIQTRVLRELALEVIKSASAFVKEDEDKFIQQMRETSAIQQEQSLKVHQKRMAKEQRRITELNTLIKRTYEDNVSGKLSDKRFELLAEEYEQEQSELEQSISQLQAEIDSFNEDSTRADKFIEIVKRHTDYSELTPKMITEYIDKIIVYEAERIDGDRLQKVEIYLNFVGKFDIPFVEPTPEEIAAEERRKKHNKINRERQRRYTTRKKAEMEQAKLETEKSPDTNANSAKQQVPKPKRQYTKRKAV